MVVAAFGIAPRAIADPAPLGAPSLAGFLASAAKRVDALVAVEAPGRAGPGPGHGLRERLARLERRPRRLGEHADAVAASRTTRDDAGNRLGLGVVDLVRHRAFDRRAQHGAVQHVRDLHVDAVAWRVPLTLPGSSTRITSLPISRKSAWLLELLRLDLRRLGRHLGERGDLAIAQPAAGFRVHHHARLGGQLLDRHAPACFAALSSSTRRTCAPNRAQRRDSSWSPRWSPAVYIMPPKPGLP